ncbi:MAG: SEC-C domain-containing protein [Planctomycetaceae bacterium]|nr:SEC-C domain-containing protein [Planctomycetaceae bacterium]
MAADVDVYQSCPCGSGKKLKFCCHAIAGDILKITDMQRHHQYQMALAALDGLQKKQLNEVWSRAWVKTTKALIHSTLHQPQDARQMIDEVLDELPEHPLATAMNGVLTLADQGYPAAKRAIYDAFQVAAERNTALPSHLARTLGMLLAAQGHFLAARENLGLAVSFDRENQESIERFVEFERNPSIPYPLRSHYRLSPFVGNETLQADYDRAAGLAATGCFSDAAKEFGKIARQHPDQPGLWWNIALCHAWAAEDPLACQAFKAAAANDPDPESAANALLLGRLLQAPVEGQRVERVGQEYCIQSVGKLLTLLDQQPFLVRGKLPADDEDDDTDDPVSKPIAWYEILDRDQNSVCVAELTLETVALVLGQVQVFDADPEAEKPAHAFLACIGRERLAELTQRLSQIAQAEVEPTGEVIVIGVLRPEIAPLLEAWYFPEKMHPSQLDSLQWRRWEKIINSTWPEVPQEFLGGKSPTEAAKVPELHNALLAAVLALDVFCEQSGYTLDQFETRRRLGLTQLTPLDLAPDDKPEQLSILQLRRLPLDRLTDDQLVAVTNRVTRLGHSGMSYEMLQAVLSRPTLADKIESTRLYRSLAELSRRRFRASDALQWLVQGKQQAKARKQPLDVLVMWEMDEIVLRSYDRSDPQLAELAATLWNYYRPKLPGSDEVIAAILKQLELPGPWNHSGENLAGGAIGESPSLAAAGAAGGGIWTPDAQPAGEVSKLWLPGQ